VKIGLIVTLLCLSMVGTATVRGQSPTSFQIASTHVNGVKRYAPEDVIRLSGLHVGSTVTTADLTTAANRLAATGLFDSVKYTYTTMGPNLTLTFDVQEAAWTIPVVFDNFVTIGDEELTAALRKDVPSFDRTAPANQGASDFIANALQGIVTSLGVAGRVGGTSFSVTVRHSTKYVFSVHDPSPTICAVHVRGASAISEHDLTEPLAGMAGRDYSRIFLVSAENGTLLDMYHHRGYWEAQFDPPSLDARTCAGVAVTLNVREGAAYTWRGAEWSGNSVEPARARQPSRLEGGGGRRRKEAGYRAAGYPLGVRPTGVHPAKCDVHPRPRRRQPSGGVQDFHHRG
jgi:outer membrane protein assembly factor BamA